MPRLQTLAAAKVNLTLRVLARRADNNHDLTSLVAFAAIGDRLELTWFRSRAFRAWPDAAAAGAPGQSRSGRCSRGGEPIEKLKIGRFELESRFRSAPASAADRPMRGSTAADRRGDGLELPTPSAGGGQATGADVPFAWIQGADHVGNRRRAFRADQAAEIKGAGLSGLPGGDRAVFQKYQALIGGRRDAPMPLRTFRSGAALLEFIGRRDDLSGGALGGAR